jgi:integrase
MRRSEILGLEWHQVDFNRQTALLPITKNGGTREVPLSHEALDVLRRQKAKNDTSTQFPVNVNSLRLAWDGLRARAGLSELRFNDLRHEAISRFFEMGLNMPEVAVISGHRDPRMLFRYTHLRAESLLPKINHRLA